MQVTEIESPSDKGIPPWGPFQPVSPNTHEVQTSVPCLKTHVQKSVSFIQYQDLQGPHAAGQIEALSLPSEHVLQAAWGCHDDIPTRKRKLAFIALSDSQGPL